MNTDEKSKKAELVKIILESDLNNGRKIEKISRSFLGRFLKQDKIDDVMQESYLKVLRFADKYDVNKDFAPWFMSIVKSSCMDFFRKEQRKKEINETDTLSQSYEDSYKNSRLDYAYIEEDNQHSRLSEIERNKLVKKIIFENLILLKADYSDVLIRFYYLGQQYNEIAELENIPIGSVKSKLNYAKRDLKRLIKNNLNLRPILEDEIYSLL
ncbi:MAG: RNA polymerase sigma factor [Nanoarchaeota archaeon]|nr:RNA polymerase sigma factor [Nanoarchaeota archaeon]